MISNRYLVRVSRNMVMTRLQPRLYRNLSSTTISRVRLSPAVCASSSRSWRLQTPIASLPFASLRHASSGRSELSAVQDQDSSISSSVSSFDTITFDVPASNTAQSFAEGTGYMASLSPDLQYGWGITSTLQWGLEHWHFTAGLPWWGSIAAVALAVRLATLPLYIMSQDAAARQAAISGILSSKMAQMKRFKAENNELGAQKILVELQDLKVSAGIKFSHLLLAPIVQGCLGFCGFKLTRAMAVLPVPGLDHGGFLWMTDLTVSDPFLLLPMLMGLSLHLLFRLNGSLGGAAGGASLTPGMQSAMLYGLPGLTIAFGCFMPGTTVVWFAVSTITAMAQGLLLQWPGFRKWVGIAPVFRPKPAHANAASPFSEFIAKRMSKSSVHAKVPSSPKYAKPQYQSPGPKIIDTKLVEKGERASQSNNAASHPPSGKSPKPRRQASKPFDVKSNNPLHARERAATDHERRIKGR